MGFITEDRKLEGLALAQPIRDNTLLALRVARRQAAAAAARTRSAVQELARSVELRARSLEQEARFLSGGNQQKVVLAKWLAIQPGVLIFDEPTRGVDVGAKAGIHDLMRGLAREGVAILMISSEMPELIGARRPHPRDARRPPRRRAARRAPPRPRSCPGRGRRAGGGGA